MKLNEHTCIFGNNVVLVPYQTKHVPRWSSHELFFYLFYLL